MSFLKNPNIYCIIKFLLINLPYAAFSHSLLILDSMEVKPVTTRKLRRRPNDPLPLPEKRRKTIPNILYKSLYSYIKPLI